ncbi:proheparin-binding EGF-like growth factor [Gopherus flavomarginatus]|uniref:proheparin-binding EGF-like growth factor n=1 Tax=Gopherus flavomarginatus TaxID=286002 RepID=UPI0021CBB4C3|nr:proheparin-binding EGF-like growth factor [Gopherus flavomarginatus]
MKRLLVAVSVLLAAGCSVAAPGAGLEVLRGPGFQEASGGRSIARLLRSELEEERDPDGGGVSSGDYFLELPRVAFLSKPEGVVTPKKEGKGKKRRKGKGKGKKRDPCLRKYKDFCIHGECKYISELKVPSCICQPGYHGERCHGLTLPVENPSTSYDHTTALAVVAVVLSSLCLIIITALLMLRCHKRGVYDVENEEKIKLGITGNH